jgi:predicted pyridoxine 5'-phosphate oxidase superfamily flavin-nucleotide-binding protein
MSKFHEGERAVQSRSGVADEAGRLGRGITSAIPDAARRFLESQRLAVLAGVDRSGRVWASMVGGAPGLITAPSSRMLRVAAGLPDADPLSEGVAPAGRLASSSSIRNGGAGCASTAGW